MRYRLTPVLVLLASIYSSGCSSVSLPSLPSWAWSTPASQPNATAEAVFDEGMTFFNNKRYALAIDRFQRVKAEFPFSPQLVPAELKLAETYYLNKQYPEAAAAFKEFQSLHPSNENIPFVVYHLGLVHFDQFTTADRDQKLTAIAKGYFESVVKDYPNSPFAAPAKEKLAKCLEYLSQYEFNVANFYFSEKKYPAAIDRLEDILRRYRETAIAPKALYYLGESYRRQKNNVKAGLAYEALAQYYPSDPLAKEAQTRLSELSREKQDPLAILLARDGRPLYYAAPEGSKQKAEGGQPKEPTNLVAKRDVVYEEPGEEKGILRRVGSALNPLGWFSSDDKKENRKEPIETAKKEGSSGSFWSSLNPFAAKAKVEARPDPQIISNVDAGLKQKGIDSGSEDVLSKAPVQDLPKIEPPPPPTDTGELLGKIDAGLKKEGKNTSELPPPPEPSPVFKALATGGKPAAESATASSPASSALIGDIDAALKRKGIDPAKAETTVKTDDRRPTTESPAPPSAVSARQKIELAPKLPQEKGPLFLENGQYPTQENGGKVEPASRPENLEASQPPSQPAAGTPQGLPAAVVRGAPQPVKEKAEETKVAEKKKSAGDEEEPKGGLEQLKEDLGKLRDLLNPFGW